MTKTYNVTDAALSLGLSPKTVATLLYNGKLKGTKEVKVSALRGVETWVIPASEVERYRSIMAERREHKRIRSESKGKRTPKAAALVWASLAREAPPGELTAADAGTAMGISQGQVAALAKTGKIKARKVQLPGGGKPAWLIPESEVERYKTEMTKR